MMPWFMLSNLDAVDFLNQLPASSVDLIVTDPAYESLEKHRAIGTTTRLTNEWFPIFRNSRFLDLFVAMHRALKPNSHCYVMCDQETAFPNDCGGAIEDGRSAGFRFWKALIWDKCAMGMGYHYRTQHELVLFFEKGARQLNNLGVSDILPFKRIRGGYPTEKPVGLSQVLISQSTWLSDPLLERRPVVVDPFMGSASVGQAALTLGRCFIGNDVVPQTLPAAAKRLSDVGGQYVTQRPREELSLTLAR